MKDYKNIYPDLPENSDNFCLQKSCEALEKLEKEASHYHNVRKKISAIIIFFLRSVYQQVLSLLFSVVLP